jgi:Pyruvate/2-oxoacid:ferredoxin oxidoreductase gamma subunit
MEREVLLTGIGGQGVQLAARTLAVAAVAEGREVMMFGTYGGSMRGQNTDATVIIGDEALQTPPDIDEAWLALAMHHKYWADVRDRVRPGGFVLLDASIFRGETELAEGVTVVPIQATDIATDLGNARAASMVALGAFAAATGIVGVDALVAAAFEVLPPYRAQHAEGNAAALGAGHALVAAPVWGAWTDQPIGAGR